MQLDVEGLTCIVTGPTSGIGRQTATALVRRRAHGAPPYPFTSERKYARVVVVLMLGCIGRQPDTTLVRRRVHDALPSF